MVEMLNENDSSTDAKYRQMMSLASTGSTRSCALAIVATRAGLALTVVSTRASASSRFAAARASGSCRLGTLAVISTGAGIAACLAAASTLAVVSAGTGVSGLASTVVGF